MELMGWATLGAAGGHAEQHHIIQRALRHCHGKGGQHGGATVLAAPVNIWESGRRGALTMEQPLDKSGMPCSLRIKAINDTKDRKLSGDRVSDRL